MSLAAPVQTAPSPAKATVRHALADSIWRAPLVPIALAVTAGIVLDRYGPIPLYFSLIGAVVALAAWVIARSSRRPGLPLVYLWTAAAALGAAYHHAWRDVYPPDDIGNFVTEEPRPARLRGVLVEEPTIAWQVVNDPLRSMPRSDPTRSAVEVQWMQARDDWFPVSGRARLIVTGHLTGYHVGDEIELVGRLRAPEGPANPGEFDHEAHLRDQRIRAVVAVQKTPDAIRKVREGWRGAFPGWLAVVRGWGQRRLEQALPAQTSGVATALLLGDGAAMTNADWDKYIRTGVIHVLAISGQHLVVLAVFLWLALRLLGVRRRRGAWFVALFLLGYALLTGGHPPVMRSAVMVCAACLGLVLRRPVLLANSFALGWLIVALLNPTDLFGAGCQLSFLAVAILYWCTSRWFPPERDPLEQLIDENRPTWLRMLRGLGRSLLVTYAITLTVWLAVAPLVAARYHLLSPIGILLGPPLTLLTSIALIAGFLLLLAAALGGLLVPVFAAVTHVCLAACEWLVDAGDALPGGHWYVGDVPEWWLWIFYPGLLAVLVLQVLRLRWRWALAVGLAWLCVGLLGGSSRTEAREMRVTFLAVGHGGCTVIETGDGRMLLYDAGAINGPEVATRQIAPYLWSRGVRRIDEVFLSHADLDHFNGLNALLERFAVGQVTLTPTFVDKTTPGVRATVDALRRRGIPVRVVCAGDRLTAGDVDLEVLHPPPIGPEGTENARSLVLRIRHAGHVLLLTGDLEGPGLERVLSLPTDRVDVLMAPHHGSRFPNKPELAQWARPRIVVSCEGPPRGPTRPPEPYSDVGAVFLGTWPHGAITVRSRASVLAVETFRSRQRIEIRSAEE
ncbi:MAG: ComEC/Rec2 family competence protein [Gemmataceae bacterium]|nr:ComEC/Rec2 family competence protein [Gemmataceae bacterium]